MPPTIGAYREIAAGSAHPSYSQRVTLGLKRRAPGQERPALGPKRPAGGQERPAPAPVVAMALARVLTHR